MTKVRLTFTQPFTLADLARTTSPEGLLAQVARTGAARIEIVPDVPDGFEFVARWHKPRVNLAKMAKRYGADARCCSPGPGGGLPLIIRPA